MDYRDAWREMNNYIFNQIENYEHQQKISNDDAVRLIELKTIKQRMRDYELYLIEH